MSSDASSRQGSNSSSRNHIRRWRRPDESRKRKREDPASADSGRERAYLEKDSDGNNVLMFGPRILPCSNSSLAAAAVEEAKPPERQKKESLMEQARGYQLEVLEQAKSRNTIAFLETGSGKTLIAVLLMKNKAETLRGKMVAVFLVPKVPLVYQQAEVIRERTDFNVGHYCGEMGQDFLDTRRWQRELETKEVFVMTAQILLNILRHSILKFENIDLLILDECHHAVKKHPYSLVMSEFYHLTPREKRPTVFGMTASPVNLKGVSNQEDCAIKMRNLETKLDSSVCTIRDRKELEKHVHMPSETVIFYDKAAVLWSLREQIKQIEASVAEAAGKSPKRNKWKRGPRNASSKDESRGVVGRTESDGASNLLQKLRAIMYSLDELGQWCAYKVASSFLVTLRNDERTSQQTDVKYQEMHLETVANLLKCELEEGAAASTVSVEDICSADVEEGELADTKAVSGGEHLDQVLGAAVADGKVTPKVQSLIKILLKYREMDDFRAIIFVDRVAAALVLPKVLCELPSLQFLSCASLIGHNNNHEMRSRQMQEHIAKFRDGRVTLLVATSVAEEGLDIRQCNVVIRFDLAKTVLAYIQSRGRARKPGSDYILMLEKGNATHESFLRNARNSEETLRKEAVQRTVLDWTKEAEILASIEAAQGEIYQVATTGAMVSLNSAVGLVHFYCSQLPGDRYAVLKPEFKLTKHEGGGYICLLQLPCNAPVEIVEGPVCRTTKEAQQAVCLKACKILHELGAFTDMLLPDKGACEKTNDDEDCATGEPLPGTARHREYYPEGIADVLKDNWLQTATKADQQETLSVYMYKIECHHVGSSQDPLLTQTSDFAILFARELDPEILTMSMDLFVARTLTTKASLTLSGLRRFTIAEVDLLKAFHVRLMSIVLDVDVEPSAAPWDSNKAYLFALLTPSDACEIDWPLIHQVLNTDAWSNALQRPRPDVYLGTDDRALGADRREYGFGKLKASQKHPTYGTRGAVASYDLIKASGVSLPRQDEDNMEVKPKEGYLLMADGFVDVKDLMGKIVTAAHSGKRFYVESVRPDMTASSSFPRKEGYLGPVEYSTYADYYKQKYGVKLVCQNQPMIRGRGVSHCKNLLSPRFEPVSSDGSMALTEKTYYVMLPPELCLTHPLPGSLVRGALRLPSVMRRVESILLAIQLRHQINYPLPSMKVLEALTAASCQETFCYERAELLGDAYLKWVVSRRLFLKFPTKHEGQLTRMRQQSVSNAVLYEFAVAKSLQSYIQADRFSPSRWAAPGVPPVYDEDTKDEDDDVDPKPDEKQMNVESGPSEQEVEDDSSSLEDGEVEGDTSSYRVLSSKALADVVEALIGTYYVEGGQNAATHLMNWIGITTDYESSEAEKAREGCVVPETVMKTVDIPSIEGALGYKFQSKGLLVEALSHASRPSAGIPCYQRLEFVGDAVLDHLITRYLFFRYQELPPGSLTDLRAAAVNNENFARISVKHNLHLHLRHGSSALEAQIRDFVKEIQGELDKQGLNSFGIGDFKAPKVLGDILESIAGAIFLDTGLEADIVWQVFESLLQPMVTPETLPVHPVRELQERCQQQAEGLEYKSSRAGNTATVEVFVDGIRISTGQSTQKKMAQKLAARNALAVLKEKDTTVSKGDGTKEEAGSKNAFTRQKLNDICLRNQWSMPQYRLLSESGPAHAKRFSYTVRVHRSQLGWTEYCEGQPMPSVKKAKDSAALVLLELLKASGLE